MAKHRYQESHQDQELKMHADDATSSSLNIDREQEIENITEVNNILPPEKEETVIPRVGAGLNESTLPDNWRPIDSARKDGTIIEVAVDTGGDVFKATWRKTREMKHYRWHMHGVWSDPMTNQKIEIFPTVWREVKPLGEEIAEAIQEQKQA